MAYIIPGAPGEDAAAGAGGRRDFMLGATGGSIAAYPIYGRERDWG